MQMLHVARHLVWYALVRPAHNGDWAGLLLNVMNVVYPCTLLLVAVSPRTGRVWAWWRRHRFAYVHAAAVLSRCVLLVCTFLLLPPAAWPTHTWAGYVVSASSRPLVNALALGVYDQLVKVPLPASAVQALAQTAAVFLLAYLVAPTIATQQLQLSARKRSSVAPASISAAPLPLQCGLRPEHSALLPCRPLALQVLLGLAMVAWPVWLSWAVEGRLRRQHSELCRDWGRRQAWGPGGQQLQRRRCWPCSSFNGPRASPLRDGSRPEAPGGATAASAPGARYRSSRRTAVVSLKVHDHPGTFENYGKHLASLLHEAVREQFAFAAPAAEPAGPEPSAQGVLNHPAEGTMRLRTTAAPAAPAVAAAAEPVLHTAVIRGCVQVVLWGWVPEGAAGGGAEGDGVAAQRLLQMLAGRLGAPGLVEGGTGGVRGVSVQVGQAVAVARDTGGMRWQEEEEQAGSTQGVKKDGSSNGTSRLLKLSPPAAAASGPLAVRLLLHSPAPQPARVLVLAERQGRGGAVPPRAVLLRDLAVALEGGVQEVKVELGAGEVAGAVDGGERPAGVGVLRVMLVGPVHVPQGAESVQQQGQLPPSLMHWVAPPLLLLPEEAVGELCGVWEQIKWEQEEEEHQQHQEQLREATPDGSQLHAAAPTGPAEALAGVEQESFLWWSHMAPLLGDLAYALADGAGQEADREEVLTRLLTFLQENGMQHTATLLQQLPLPMPLYDHAHGNGAVVSSGQFCLARNGSPQLTTATCSSSDAPAARSRATFGQPSYAVFSLARGLPLLLSISPFSPPALELSYQAWRLAGLAATAPCMLLATAQPLLLALARAALQHGLRQAALMGPLALPPAAESAVAAAVRRYTLAGVLLGPVILLSASVAVTLGLLPYFDSYVGSNRSVLLACLHRAMLLPSLQRLPVRQVLAVSPLLAAGEALQLAALQPAWGWRRVAGHVALWRLAAAAVSVAWESCARRRFATLVVQRQEGEAGGGGHEVAAGSGSNMKHM